MKFDLHSHSTCSDGTFTPKELMYYAKEKGLDAIALSDHDCIRGLSEAQIYADDLGIKLINAIEFAAFYRNKEIHILGLFVDINDEVFAKTVNDIEIGRYERNAEMVRRFNNIDIPITLADLDGGNPNKVITRLHFAEYLTENGHVPDNDTAFERYLWDGCETYIAREYLTPKEVIEIVHKAGGIAIFAHPNFYGFDFDGIKSAIEELASYGLDGVEGYYPTYTEEEGEFIRQTASDLGLTITGGSDFHGESKPGLDLYTGFDNTLVIPDSVLDDILEKHGYTL